MTVTYDFNEFVKAIDKAVNNDKIERVVYNFRAANKNVTDEVFLACCYVFDEYSNFLQDVMVDETEYRFQDTYENREKVFEQLKRLTENRAIYLPESPKFPKSILLKASNIKIKEDFLREKLFV